MDMKHADIGILFGERMSDATLQARYAPLVGALGELGVEPLIFRAAADDFDPVTQAYPAYSVLDEQGVARHSEPATADLLRDFNGKRQHGTIPAINDPALWELSRDKAKTYETFADLMPTAYILNATRSDAEDARQSLPGTLAVIKPTTGRASRGVSVVALQDKEAWQAALDAIDGAEQVMVEDYVDTTKGHAVLPELEGRPYTTRVISVDGEPSVVAIRAGRPNEQKVNGDDSEEYIFADPERLTDDELSIVQTVHARAAAIGNGYSYFGVDLLQGTRTYLGEINSRPEIIEPSHDPHWSARLALDSARQLVRAHRAITTAHKG